MFHGTPHFRFLRWQIICDDAVYAVQRHYSDSLTLSLSRREKVCGITAPLAAFSIDRELIGHRRCEWMPCICSFDYRAKKQFLIACVAFYDQSKKVRSKSLIEEAFQMNTFKAFRIDSKNGQVVAGFENITLDDLTPGDVVINSVYSGINYKDALAATGKGAILRKFPLVGGIDVAGIVDRSDDHRFSIGDEVLVCGSGLSETRDGGYAEYVRGPGGLRHSFA